MVTSARESFAAFLNEAWAYLSSQEHGAQDERVTVPTVLRVLYSLASAPNDPHTVKDVVSPPRLYEDMIEYVTATVPWRIVMQTAEGPWKDISESRGALVEAYRALTTGEPLPAGDRDTVGTLPASYLHVYPRDAVRGNWRIGINVRPRGMAQAVRVLAPLLDGKSEIAHIKFMGPGGAAKCDSALIYLVKAASHEASRARIVELAQTLDVEPTVARMWEEIAPGIAEAGEPPKTHGLYVSFTAYRCLVVYLAYREYTRRYDEPDLERFQDFLRIVMPLFGLDFDAPHVQAAVPEQLENPESRGYLEGYLALKKAWMS